MKKGYTENSIVLVRKRIRKVSDWKRLIYIFKLTSINFT